MDSTKKGRGRVKPSSVGDSQVENQTDANAVNGEDAEGAKMVEKQDVADSREDSIKEKIATDEDKEDDANKKELKVNKGRKRKASEMKSGDENSSEEGPKEKEPTVEKKTVVDSSSSKNKENVDKKDKAADSKDKETKEAGSPETKPSDKGDSSASDGDINLPPKEAFGKGKRARIPNKRYSDILLTPNTHRSRPTVVENGEKRDEEKIESENNAEEASNPTVAALKSRSSSGSPFPKKAKFSVDMSNPSYLKPFKLGWRRELVYRATTDNTHKRNGDIYYYTPSGKKVRSMREVSEHLSGSGLSLDDFTFFKEPLGLDDPEKEIIRDAKVKYGSTPVPLKKSNSGASGGTPKPSKTDKDKAEKAAPAKAPAKGKASTSTPKVSASKASSGPTTKNNSNVPHVSSETTTGGGSPKAKSPSKLGNFKIKLPPKKAIEKKGAKQEDNMEVEAGPSSTKWSGKKTGKWSNSDNSKPCQPCSIRCPTMMGVVPTLQCRLCLCLYHHGCVGMTDQETEVQVYVCKNCQLDQEKGISTAAASPMTNIAPPPLTPINSLKTTNTKPLTLPKLQRIPRPGDVPPLQPASVPIPTQNPLPEMPRLMPRPAARVARSPSTTEGKGLVGSVTTWLPQNSRIQLDVNQRNIMMASSPRPQFVEYLGGRKFLIIPKHHIVSISPTVAVTATNKPEEQVVEMTDDAQTDQAAGLGLKDASEIKPEPESPSKPENSQTEAMDVDPPGPTATDGACEETTAAATTDTQVNPVEGPEDETEKPAAAKNAANNNNKKRPIPRLSNSIVATGDSKKEDSKFMDNYLQNLSYGYNTLLYVFQYLKVQDLLRAGCVCTMWRDIASHPLLWRTVRMKNSQVHDYEGLANTLQKHGTVHLDLRKMLLPNFSSGDDVWRDFNKAIERVTTLRKVELCRCPAFVVEQLSTHNPKLEVVNALTIKCESMNLDPLAKFTDLRELRLKSTAGLTFSSDLDALKCLTTLKHLSLTSIRDLHKLNLDVIAELKNLESLDLGECMDFPRNFGSDILAKLPKLEKLRLEKGQGHCHTFEILDAVKDLKSLEQLELVNFDIKAGFDKALGNCFNIKRLLIIPTYISQSATTNHMVLGGVLRLQKTLSHFVWGVTLELLRVTELFVDQCEEPEKAKKDKDKDKDKEKRVTGAGDSIPVLKPVPLITERESEIPPAHDPPEVEILPLPNLQKLLLQSLPTTRVKILKIPFHATWRQSITDSVN